MNEIRRSYDSITAEIAKLLKAQAALADLLETPPAITPSKGKRPPRGHVEKSILETLTSKGMTNTEVREKLISSGYAYPLHALQTGKALNRFAVAKKIKKSKNGNRVEFSLK